MSSYDEDEEEPHMLAVSNDDSLALHDEIPVLDPDEEMMMMHEQEATGNITPPSLQQEDEDEPANFVKPKPTGTNGDAVDDSFESYIFDSDGDDDFQTRGRNHVIPVINSSPTKKKRGDTDNVTDPSTSPQSPPSECHVMPQGLFERKEYGDMYVSPPSSSDYGPSPRGPAPQSAFSPKQNGQQHQPLPNFRHTAPVIQTTASNAIMPSAQSAPLTIPDGKSPIVLDTPQGYRNPPSRANAEQSTRGSSSINTSRHIKAFMWGMSKPVFCALAFYLLFMTGSFAYFVSQYVQIPDLRDQVDQLTAEVDRLEAQVNELESLISELNVTVDELSTEVSELQVENDKLETQNAILADANDTFGNKTAVLQEQVDILQSTISNLTLANEFLSEEALNLKLLNDELTNLTESLRENATALAERAENLTAVNDDLVDANEVLTNQTDALQANLGELVLEFDAAYETVVELQDEVAVLEDENNRLGNLTESLGTILTFLEETNQNADVTVEQLASQLEEQITNSRRLVLENLQNTLAQRTQSWNCDYINAFAGTSFAEDYSIRIPSGNYDSVIDYVENRVLTDLCLDRSDFELYLSVNFMPNGDGLTSNELISGVSMYTSGALNYYFPDANEAGVTPEEWAEAFYACANLPANRQYNQ